MDVGTPPGPAREGSLSTPGGQDDRGGEQEGEARGVWVRQTSGQAADHGDARAADPREQGERLERNRMMAAFAVVQGSRGLRAVPDMRRSANGGPGRPVRDWVLRPHVGIGA